MNEPTNTLIPRTLGFIVMLAMLGMVGCASGSSTMLAISLTLSPQSANVQVSQQQPFTATVSGDDKSLGVTWSLSGAGCTGNTCGTLSSSTSASGTAITYTAPAAIPTPATVTLTATSVADASISSPAIITVVVPAGNISVSVSPKRGGLTQSQTLNLTASVNGDATSAGVIWSVSGGGIFTNATPTAAIFTAPNSPGVVTVTATSVADPTKSASATIGVTDLAGVFTYHNDLARDGANTQEYALTTANVASATFGKLFSCPVDGAVYAQPLWVANLTIGAAKHNAVFVATTHDTVYAFDADASPCQTLWSKSLLGAGETWVDWNDVNTGDIQPDIGIIGTPVIDPATRTLYVVAKSKLNGGSCTPSANCHQRLHALSLLDSSENVSPIDITSAISVPGTGDGSLGGSLPFDPLRENERCGLVLANGIVYVAWASHGDNLPYHGWVMGFDKSTLQRVATFNANPNGDHTGIWMAGAAPSVDSSGNLYFLTGNGTFDANTVGGVDYGDSTVKLSTAAGVLSVSGYFSPADQSSLSSNDADHGSGGAAILLDQPPGSPHQHLLIGGGKEGNLFLLDRDNLGGYGGDPVPADSNAVQKFSIGNAIFATAAFWSNALYLAPSGGPLKAFSFNAAAGNFNTAPSSQSANSFFRFGASPSVSSHGAANGIVWALDFSQYCTQQALACGPVVLHAYDATNLASELWNSAATAGNAVKFTVPTVANGKVYIGTRGNSGLTSSTTIPGELDVYGLLPN